MKEEKIYYRSNNRIEPVVIGVVVIIYLASILINGVFPFFFTISMVLTALLYFPFSFLTLNPPRNISYVSTLISGFLLSTTVCVIVIYLQKWDTGNSLILLIGLISFSVPYYLTKYYSSDLENSKYYFLMFLRQLLFSMIAYLAFLFTD